MGPLKLLKLVPVHSGDQIRFIGMDIVGDYSVEKSAALALALPFPLPLLLGYLKELILVNILVYLHLRKAAHY